MFEALQDVNPTPVAAMVAQHWMGCTPVPWDTTKPGRQWPVPGSVCAVHEVPWTEHGCATVASMLSALEPVFAALNLGQQVMALDASIATSEVILTLIRTEGREHFLAGMRTVRDGAIEARGEMALEVLRQAAPLYGLDPDDLLARVRAEAEASE